MDTTKDDAADVGSVRRDDAEPITPSILLELRGVMRRRASRTSDAVFTSVKERLRAEALIGHGKCIMTAEERPEVTFKGKHVLQDICKDGEHVQQIVRSEKQWVKLLREMADPEAIKQNPGYRLFKDAVHREVSMWRDGGVLKVVTKVAESKQMTDRLVEHIDKGVAAGGLVPNHGQLQDLLQEKMRLWLTDGVAARLRTSLVDSTLPQARVALDRAMQEITAQSTEAVSMTFRDARKSVGADEFLEICRLELAVAIRHQVQKWEDNVANASRPAPSHVSSPELGKRFSAVLRTASEPLWRDLEVVERDVAHAASFIESARASADIVEACRRGGSDAHLAATRAAVSEAVTGGRIREAFERALSWDMQHLRAAGLAQFVCDQLATAAGSEEEVQPVDILSRADVSAALDMDIKCQLMVVLVHCIGCNDAELPRVTSNLEWLLAILQFVDGTTNADVLNGLENHGSFMISTLEALAGSEAPAAVSKAEPPQKKHVVSMARFALKGLRMLIGGMRR